MPEEKGQAIVNQSLLELHRHSDVMTEFRRTLDDIVHEYQSLLELHRHSDRTSARRILTGR